MTQQFISEIDAALEKAWARIGHDRWDQMAWFVKLANTDVPALSPGDVQNLQDECTAVWKTPLSFHSDLSDRKRYPYLSGGINLSQPTPTQLVEIQAAIVQLLESLADGRDTRSDFIPMQYKIRFRRTTDIERQAGYPPHIIYPIYLLVDKGKLWPNELLLRMTRLLEVFVDGIRRCPHCEKVFLQLRRNATYCGRACHSVAGMQRLRGRQALEGKGKTQDRKTTRKGRSPHGKKRR